MRFSALQSAGFALQLSESRFLNFDYAFEFFRKFEKFEISKFKNLLLESCRAKPADSNAENRIALPSKLTEICNFEWSYV